MHTNPMKFGPVVQSRIKPGHAIEKEFGGR